MTNSPPEWATWTDNFEWVYLAGKKSGYILYRPRSSSERPSSHLRSSSLVDFSEMALEIFELFRTSSSTKMGQSTRRASARASLGRESMEKLSPLRSTQISA